MITNILDSIEKWDEDDLMTIPANETDFYEYKSSKIYTHPGKEKYPNNLQKKLLQAASAFWNTGGGIFIVGVDDKTGKIDGGIPPKVGNQAIQDWIDMVLTQIQPLGKYIVNTIAPKGLSSQINTNHIVLVVGFDESLILPHMAPDNIYYIRTGARTTPAGHYIVEAMRARRGLREPMLRGFLREHDRKLDILQLVVSPANDNPALDVSITFDPLPSMFQHPFAIKRFPLRIPMIDRNHPFKMDVGSIALSKENFGEKQVKLLLNYSDAIGKQYTWEQVIDPQTNMSPFQSEFTRSDDPKKTLIVISKELKNIVKFLKKH